MLNYKVRMSDNQIVQKGIEWEERYVAQDLSYVSGVTDTDYNIDSFRSLSVESRAGGGTDIVSVNSTNVKRTGFVVVYGKSYDVHSAKTTNFIVSATPASFKYIELNGRYYYCGLTGNTFEVDKWLVSSDTGVIETSVTVTAVNDVARIDTVYWVKDDTVTIDGNDYYVDYQTNPKPTIRYYEGSDALEYSSITDCTGIEITQFTNPVEKAEFILTKVDDREVQFDSIGFCDYYFFVDYNNTYCSVVPSSYTSGDSETINTFVCLVPNKILGTEPENGFTPYSLYSYVEDMGGGTIQLTSITSSIELRDMYAFTKIGNEEVQVSHTVLSSNGGPRVITYLTNDAVVKNLNPGNRIEFRNEELDTYLDVYEDEDGEFVLFNGKKNYVVENLCDKVVMLDYEYDITYPDGKHSGSTALVSVEGEQIPMELIRSLPDNESIPLEELEAESTWYVRPYPLVVTSSATAFTETLYQITSYSGVTLGGKNYLVHVETVAEEGDEIYAKYVVYDHGNDYAMMVEEVIGSSAVVCYPDLYDSEFSDDFIDDWAGLIMSNVVYGANDLSLYVPNTIFGIDAITPQLAVNRLLAITEGGNFYIPKSSDEYYSLTDDLIIYVNNRYINIPITLSLGSGGDPNKDDVVDTLFYDEERRNSINRIVDMERDVYTPKTLVGEYNGSEAVFNSIYEIQINVHLRTRDMYNWKVNETAKGVAFTSANTNWFVTDFYPYKDIVDGNDYVMNRKLDSTSDIAGLWMFTNEDVYYQKSRVANTFLRLSYYDSVDPQSQSLLHMSTVFMDEHAIYKRYIDNSRKGKDEFINYSIEPYGTGEGHQKPVITQKISVSSEELQNNHGDDMSKVTLDDSKRISTRFVVKNKYATDTSSEGFYLYVFKEYSEKLHPKPIYMKVELNHAGIGQTLPLTVPMIWDNGHPKSAITLSSSSDVTELKKGIRLQDFYQCIYIPLYAVYDYKNNEYVYVFDDRYVKVEDGIAVLNLYEVKVMDESDSDPGTDKLEIDINEQFKDLCDI